MAINLASKYSDQIAEVFTRASFIKGKTAETYDLTGVKTLKVYTPITVEEVDYDRDGGLKRYGDVTEMQDVVQELTMTQDKAFTLTIDKGNNLDQNLVKNAADMLRLQLNESPHRRRTSTHSSASSPWRAALWKVQSRPRRISSARLRMHRRHLTMRLCRTTTAICT